MWWWWRRRRWIIVQHPLSFIAVVVAYYEIKSVSCFHIVLLFKYLKKKNAWSGVLFSFSLFIYTLILYGGLLLCRSSSFLIRTAIKYTHYMLNDNIHYAKYDFVRLMTYSNSYSHVMRVFFKIFFLYTRNWP